MIKYNFTFIARIFFLFTFFIINVHGSTTDSFFFSSSPKDQDVEEGKPFRLECRVTPEKDIVYSWERNNERIPGLGERLIMEDGSNLMVFHADAALDSGTYACLAYNKTSRFTRVSRAEVKVFRMSPFVTVKMLQPSSVDLITKNVDVILECNSQAEPRVHPDKIQWFHNGHSNLPNGIMKRVSDGTLVISGFQVRHNGAYHCKVLHSAGRMDSKPPFVLFMDPVTNQMKMDLKNEDFFKQVPFNSSLKLTCPVVNDPSGPSPPSAVYWGYWSRLDDNSRSLSDLSNVQQNGPELSIPSFRQEHMNLYYCDYTKLLDSSSYTVRFLYQVELAVIFPIKSSQFSPRPRNMTFGKAIDSDLIIRFYMDLTPYLNYISENIPNPPPTVRWYNPMNESVPIWNANSTLSSSSSSSLSSPPRIYTTQQGHLFITKIQKSDSGYYRIALNNVAGVVSLTFYVAATYAPTFTPRSSNAFLVADEGNSLQIDCGLQKFVPSPASQIEWSKDNQTINKQDKFEYEADRSILVINKIRIFHDGNYRCHVDTIGFKLATSAPIRVAVREKLHFEHEVRFKFLENKVQGRIPCYARGYGNISITWFRQIDNDLLPIRKPNQIDDGQLILQIVTKNDAGVYVCQASSDYQNQKITMSVTVAVGESPQIVKISDNDTIPVGDAIMLNCEATGDPAPKVSWIVNSYSGNEGEPLTYQPDEQSAMAGDDSSKQHKSKRRRRRNDDDDDNNSLPSLNIDGSLTTNERRQVFANGSLFIRHAIAMDDGEYVCVAANSYSMSSRKGVFLRVLSREEFERNNPKQASHGMLRTILIVVSCALAYLILIVVLTIFCSMRMLNNRRRRARLSAEKQEGIRLLNPGETRSNNGNVTQQGIYNELTPGDNNNIGINNVNGYYRRDYSNTESIFPPLPPPSVTSSCVTPGLLMANPALQSNSMSGFGGMLPYASDGTSAVGGAPPPPTPIDSRSYMSGFSGTTAGVLDSVTDIAARNSSLSYPGGGGGPTVNRRGFTMKNDDKQLPLTSLDRLAYPRHLLIMEGLLGRGEFGDVCLMRASQIIDGENQSLVLVKSLALKDPLHIYEFQRQMDMFTKLDHDCITRVLGVCLDTELRLMILEYCEWGDLKQYLRCVASQQHATAGSSSSHTVSPTTSGQNRTNKSLNMSNRSPFGIFGMPSPRTLPPPTVRQNMLMCSQIVMGMEHLSNMRCVHRDLAARNILLTRQLQVKISHLGLCRDFYSQDYCLLRDRYLPIRWMSPEAILHDTFSNKSDVWSFGLLVCELFTLAQQPYPHMNDSEVLNAAAAHTLQPEVPFNCPEQLRELLLQCWRESPNDRPDFGDVRVLLCDIKV